MKNLQPSLRRFDAETSRPSGATDENLQLRSLLREAYPALPSDVPLDAAETERFTQRVVRQLPPRRSTLSLLLEALWSPLSLWSVVGVILFLLRRPLIAGVETLVSCLVRSEMPPQGLLYTVAVGITTYLFLFYETWNDAERR